MKVTTYDVLARSHELLTQGWCQFEMALDAQGKALGVTSPYATRFCAIGAVERAAAELATRISRDVLHSVAREAGVGRIDYLSAWNDAVGRTQAEVLAVFARAAEKVRGEGEE